MSEKYTPGPWQAVNNKQYWEIRTDPSDGGFYSQQIGDACASCFIDDHKDNPVAEANARLMAAAPELLEALKAVVSVADRSTVEFDMARVAIAKATGEKA